MKKSFSHSLFLLICLFSTFEINAQIFVKGSIVSSDTKEKVSYASVLLTVNGNLVAGTVADKSGEFSLNVNDISNAEIVVSAIGYYEYVRAVKDFDSFDTVVIKLKEQDYVLPDVIVNNKQPKRRVIGFPDVQLDIANKIRGAMATRQHGLETGVHYLPDSKDVGKTVDSIKFYVNPSGSVDADLLFRVQEFVNDSRASLRSALAGRVRRDSCLDVISKGVQLTVAGSDWYNIDLTGFDIVVPASGLFISYVTAECRDRVKWQYSNDDYGYGVYVPPYVDKFPRELRYIVMNKGNIVIFNAAPYMVPMFVIYLS